MLIDGEKYACEACVRGHRVSNCQHHDRPLQHINKKGRPVSQCQHCRAARKSRAAHVKCDCGEKTNKCAHLQPVLEGHKETCCCNHGGRCTCAQKKEPALDTVPESDSDRELRLAASARPKGAARRRRANTIHSDGVLSLEQGGHPRPATKHSRVSQKSGPYQLNRANSANSTDGMMPKTDSRSVARARAGSTRRVKSEATSPMMAGSSFPPMHANLTPLDLSSIEYPSFASNGSFDILGTGVSDHDAPIFSAGLTSGPVDWAHYGFDSMKNDFGPESYGQAASAGYSGQYDFGHGELPNLTNTTTTSGEVSEVEDFMSGGDADFESFGGSGLLPQGNLMSGAAEVGGIEYDGLYKDGALAGPGISSVEDDPAFWMPNYNDGVATIDDAQDALGTTSHTGGFWDM
ncbi:hypothetical protein B0I35DRAFT_408478 [Stachybotrys elegans]|uniref:Copper-fist domain-containing protein n=1 Tax=Stachybotrys elegans TaxID=80388 RepID=A0A8K0SXC8_9HYPO|nr:hypothetical protein B0I35DRAFT_408478 [Stachybotrys elegans]